MCLRSLQEEATAPFPFLRPCNIIYRTVPPKNFLLSVRSRAAAAALESRRQPGHRDVQLEGPAAHACGPPLLSQARKLRPHRFSDVVRLLGRELELEC